MPSSAAPPVVLMLLLYRRFALDVEVIGDQGVAERFLAGTDLD